MQSVATAPGRNRRREEVRRKLADLDHRDWYELMIEELVFRGLVRIVVIGDPELPFTEVDVVPIGAAGQEAMVEHLDQNAEEVVRAAERALEYGPDAPTVPHMFRAPR